MDLIARIVLGELSIIPEKDMLHENFKLHLYASFRNRNDTMGLELMEKL